MRKVMLIPPGRLAVMIVVNLELIEGSIWFKELLDSRTTLLQLQKD